MKNKSKLKWLLILIAIVAVIMVAIQYGGNNPRDYQTYEVISKTLNQFVEETGTVKSNSQRKIFSEVQDKIIKVNFKVGDSVKKGSVLLVFDQTQIQSEINLYNAKVQEIQAAYKEATKTADKEKIEALEAKIKNIELELVDARRVLDNKDKLYAQGAISSDEFIALQKQELTLENDLISAQNELALLQKGASGEVKKQFEAQIKQINETIKSLEDRKANYTIKAPIDGIITEKFVKEGNYVAPGTELLEISNENDLYVDADILVSEIKNIKVGNKVIVYNEDLDVNIPECMVSKIYPKAHTKISDLGIEQKRVTIEIELSGDISLLKEGYDVDVKIITDTRENVLVIDKNDIYEENKKEYVDVLVNNKLDKREIKTGIEEDDYIEVLEGLNKGDKVVKLEE